MERMIELTNKRIEGEQKKSQKLDEKRREIEMEMSSVQLKCADATRDLETILRSIQKERREREFVNASLVKSEREVRSVFERFT